MPRHAGLYLTMGFGSLRRAGGILGRRLAGAVILGLAETAVVLSLSAAVTVPSGAQVFDDRFPFIGEARGLGAMRALEIVADRTTKKPDKERTNQILRKAWENGLILISAGTYGNVIRTLMPLVITDAQLQEGLEVLEHALL